MTDTFKTFGPIAWRNLWRNPRRTVITLIVVSVGLWSILFFNSFMIAWMQSSKDATLSLLIGRGQIHAPGFMDDPNIDLLMTPPDATLKAALDAPEIADWTARLNLPGVVQSEYKTLPITIMGVDPALERKVSSIPGKLAEGRYLSGPEDDAVILGLHLAERLKTGIGRRVILMSQSRDGTLAERSFDVVGLFDADKQTEDFFAFTGLAAAQSFVGLDNKIAEIVFTLADETALPRVITSLESAAPDLDVRSWKDLSLFLAASDSFMQGFIFIWLAVVFSLMAIGIVNTQLMAVFERMKEFGLLRALGMKSRLVLLMVSMESALLIGLGTLCGMALAALSIFSLRDGVDLSAFAEGLEMIQSGRILHLTYHWESFVEFSLIIWLLGILVALWPAFRASRSSPVEAMRRAT
ncbi:MAG: ABC transporter permease [Paracoccaceae bacterium]